MEKSVVINLKPSNKIVQSFKRAFPNAHFFGSSSLGSKSKSYYISLKEYEEKKECIKNFGSKSRHQPFL